MEMKYRIVNRSNQVVGLVVNEVDKDGNTQKVQKNLFPRKSLKVDEVTEQMYNLADPSKNILSVEEVK